VMSGSVEEAGGSVEMEFSSSETAAVGRTGEVSSFSSVGGGRGGR
jgi:hypothetical protein